MSTATITKTLTETLTLEVTDCINCGVIFAMPQGLYRQLRRDGKTFYCPSGHQMYFAETEADRLRRELEDKERYLSYARADRDRYRQRLGSEQNSHRATKGHLTRARKRAAAALCPVDGCGRSFVQLRRHLASKHPDYQPEAS